MPSRISKPCKYPGCTSLTIHSTGYCLQHKSEASHWGKYQEKQGTTTQRGYGAAWERLRKAVIQRDNGLCQMCYRAGRLSPGTEVDHIIPKAAGGDDSQHNLQLLCSHCHRYKTTNEDSKL